MFKNLKNSVLGAFMLLVSLVASTVHAAPPTPGGVTATSSNGQVVVSWAASAGANFYSVRRATAGSGPYSNVAAAQENKFVDAAVTAGTTYYYVVAAVGSSGESANSAAVVVSAGSGTPTPPPPVSGRPATPANLSATAGSNQIVVAWTASTGASFYSVRRATASSGPYTNVAAAQESRFVDRAVSTGTTYYYIVAAVGSGGESANTAAVAATVGSVTPPVPAVPAVPQNFQAAAGDKQVFLAWASSSGATGYRVKRATTSGGPYTQVAAPTGTSYTNAALTNGVTYYYVVTASNSTGESANSTQVSAKPVAAAVAPAAPTGLSATAGNAQVALSWSASSGASGYRVKRATSNGGPYTQVAAPASTSYGDASLTNGVAYYYVVTAVNATGESANSAQAAATPQAPVTPPTTGLSMSGLRVVGNQIRNGSNQTVSLRGVNKAGTEYMCLGGPLVFDGPSDAASVTVLKSWAINVVRLPINEDCWLGINGVAVGGTAYRNAIVNYVNLLTAGNIATIIDLQWAAPGTTVSNQLTPMPDADHAPAFWSSVAGTFKSNSAVIFDLFNEPYPDSNRDTVAAWTCLRYGGTCAGIPYQVAGMQSLVDTVRATGSTNIVMIPGLQYANLLTQWLAYRPNDATGNLVAAWHSYATQWCNNQACWDTYIKPVLQTVPVITGEIGQNDCQSSYVNPLMSYLDANGGHYLAWAWNTYDCSSFPSLLANYNGTPTAFGAAIRDHYLAMASGTPPVPPATTFFSSSYPFGIAVGSSARFTASDGTVYYPDVPATGLSQAVQYFTPFTTGEAIGGTADPALYKQGRQGVTGSWTINVPNGNYQVTLGMAPNSAVNAGEFGQDQNINGQKLGTCVWSRYSGANISPTSGAACPGSATPVPAAGTAYSMTYTVTVTNQQLLIQPAASFGGGRTTMLNTIRVAKAQ